MVGVLVPAAVLGLIVLLVVLLVRRSEGTFSPGGILRFYLYAGSLAGIIALAVGLGSVLDYGLARVAGDAFIYGSSPVAYVGCPPGSAKCPPATELQRQQRDEQRRQRRDEDLIRGITFTAFGALFWAAHWAARRGVGEEGPAGALRRGYLLLGTGVFGLGTIVLLPTGVYQALANAILTTGDNVFRPGADSLGGGIVSLPIWLVYLRLAVVDLRRGP